MMDDRETNRIMGMNFDQLSELARERFNEITPRLQDEKMIDMIMDYGLIKFAQGVQSIGEIFLKKDCKNKKG